MIYFITDGEYTKIGFTDRGDTQERLEQLQIGNARQLVIVGIMEGDRAAETFLHQVLLGLKVRGEWYNLNREGAPQIINYDCSICGQPFGTTQALNAHQRIHREIERP